MFRKILSNPYLILISRILLGCLFIFAAVGKIAEPTVFAKEILNYKMMYEPFINIIALFLPWIELICGLLLLTGIKIKTASMLTGLMMIIFIIAVGYAVIQGLNINCGCFAKNMAQKTGIPKLIENAAFLLFCLHLYFFQSPKFSLENYLKNEID